MKKQPTMVRKKTVIAEDELEEESKGLADDGLHFYQINQTIDFEQALEKKGLRYETEGAQSLVRIDGEDMQRVSSQEEFEELGELTIGYVQ